DGEHIGGDGGLCGARRAEMHCVYPRWQDCLGQAVAGDGLWRADGAVEDGLRRMPEAADQTGAAVPDLPAELGESLSAGGTEDPGDGDCGTDGVADSGAPGGSGREPGQLVGAGQRISGDE